MARLCVNIDHIATLRQARGGNEPDPVAAAAIAEKAGAFGITVHLREDRRHIQDKDVILLKKTVKTKLNLEMSLTPEIVDFAVKIAPDEATIVPEKRRELTTEGGLDVIKNMARLKDAIARLKAKNVMVSLFIDAEPKQIKASKQAGADYVELHTGRYANAKNSAQEQKELKKIKAGVMLAVQTGLKVNAGHGLNYENTKAVASIKGIEDLNTGHSIIARAVFTGLECAVKDMLKLL
ncbi:MAG TPA: pyridoxine 5'-phosphate synthase [Candidatus Goldiibacteriota bacterium]|nr:pyridoxine 5'-phosphate synthase [Candidatus Goldiibacteriota bacterium]HPI03515.1 pyridoxine 5'-phosphate synthase [Candidatus Goldiibacteriota bacterium]HPN64725.1 pyridoxine 5'-phosphate synthase [Candidatus Goldiibacteriota bacterium]HRQ44374.1 pyridoxine 5'-phosphate synthase [Candidatus Goldiibacteriota bacterium]